MDDSVSAANIRAWDQLYGETKDLVWGDEPIGFLEEFVGLVSPKLTPVSRILDAATGEGRNLGILLRSGAEVDVCDASTSALHKIPAGFQPRIRRVACNLAQLPFANEEFDLVLCTDVIETLPEPDAALQEFHRVLKVGGKFLCNIPGMEDEIAGIEMKPLGENKFLFRNAFYYQFLSESEATNLLTRNGFHIIKNAIRTWREPAHPEFRGTPHTHTSRVFLVEKADR